MIPGLFPEAAASAAVSFPVSGDLPDVPRDESAGADVFADLLTASIESPAEAVAAPSAPAHGNVSLDALWLRGLFPNVSVQEVLSAVDAEGAVAVEGEPGDSLETRGEPAVADTGDLNADAPLMAYAVPMPVPMPAPMPVTVPVTVPVATEIATARGASPSAFATATADRSGSAREPERFAPQAMSLELLTSREASPVGSPGEPAPVAVALAKAEGFVPQAKSPEAMPARAVAPTVRLPGSPSPDSASDALSLSKGIEPVPSVATATKGEEFIAPTRAVDIMTGRGASPAGSPGEPERFAPHAKSETITARAVARAVSPAIPASEPDLSAVAVTKPEAFASQAGPRVTSPEFVTARGASPQGSPGEPAGFAPHAKSPIISIIETMNTGQEASQNGRRPSLGDVPENAAPAKSSSAPQIVPVLASSGTDVVVRPASPLAVAAPVPISPESEVENLTRLVESMRVQYRQGIPEATIRLNPEHLGEVTISIRVDRGAVSAVVQADSPAAQQWLESQEDRLRSGLADQGLNLERYVVQRDRQPQERRESRQQQPPPRYRQPAVKAGERFEVTV